MQRVDSLEKTLMLGKIEGKRRKQQRINSWMATLTQWIVLDKGAIYISSSLTQSCLTLCDPIDCNMPGFPVHQQLPELTQTHVHWVGDTIQPFHPLSSPSPGFNLFQHQGLFQRVRSLHQMAKVLELQLLHQSFQGTFRTDFFRTDWVDLLAVQGTLKSLLQHHSSKTSVLRHSAFLMVQLSHPYMTTRKTIAFTAWNFVSQVMSLLVNTLSRFLIAFLPRSKCLLILWLQLLYIVILEPKKIKCVTVSSCPPLLPFHLS